MTQNKLKIKWQFHSIQYRLLSDLSSTIRLYLNALGNRAVKVCNQLKET